MDSATNTRYRLANALKDLVRSKPLDKITVKQIADACGVSRQTFYRCFLDKYDLVNWYFERLVERSFQEMEVSLTLREGLRNKFRFRKIIDFTPRKRVSSTTKSKISCDSGAKGRWVSCGMIMTISTVFMAISLPVRPIALWRRTSLSFWRCIAGAPLK